MSSTMTDVFPESWPPTNATTAGRRSGYSRYGSRRA
jgi:hypothetical protein